MVRLVPKYGDTNHPRVRRENSIKCYKIDYINIQTLAGKPVEVPIREATRQYPQSKGAPLMKIKNNWQLILIKQQKEKEQRKHQAKLAMAMR